MNTPLRSLCLAITLLIGMPAHSAFAAGHTDAGGKVFDSECSDCHSVKAGKNKKGPSLSGIVGRRAGTITGYKYSDPLLHSAIIWTPDKIQTYLAAPKKMVPGGKMKYDSSELSAQNIADLLAFLGTVH